MFIVLVACVLVAIYFYFSEKRPFNYPPGPAWLPIFGHSAILKKLAIALGGQHLAFQQLANQYRTNVLGLKLGKSLVVTVSSFPVVKTILTSDNYIGRPDNTFIRLRCLGTRKGITCVDGDYWAEQRGFVVRHLRSLGLGKDSMNIRIKEELYDIIEILQNSENDIRIDRILAASVLNIIWALVAGSRISRNDARLTKLLDLLYRRTKLFDMSGGILNQYPWLRFVAPNKSGYTLMQNLNNELRNFFSETIKKHQENWSDGRDDDLIYSFITEMKRANGKPTTFTEEQLILVCLDLFVAGAQTTSNTLDFAFLMMILHQDVQCKAQAKLDQVFSSVDDINYNDRHKVPYIDAVLCEVERYCFVAPITGPRRVLNKTTLEGYNIPKNSTVLISTYSVHMDREYWGDPEVFRPERFLDENGQLLYHERLLTFGLGKRRCLGESLARTCLFLFFAGILHEYSVLPIPGTPLPSDVPLPGITLSPKPYHARFVKRQKLPKSA